MIELYYILEKNVVFLKWWMKCDVIPNHSMSFDQNSLYADFYIVNFSHGIF